MDPSLTPEHGKVLPFHTPGPNGSPKPEPPLFDTSDPLEEILLMAMELRVLVQDAIKARDERRALEPKP